MEATSVTADGVKGRPDGAGRSAFVDNRNTKEAGAFKA